MLPSLRVWWALAWLQTSSERGQERERGMKRVKGLVEMGGEGHFMVVFEGVIEMVCHKYMGSRMKT